MKRQTVAMVSALALGAAGVLVATQLVSGAGESDESVFVSNIPCRLLDTRSGDDNVGPVSSPIGENATVTFNAHDGSDGDSPCEIPATATAISANVVAVNPTAAGYLTLFPGDAENPGTANLNFVAGQAPTPNAAIVPLAPDGTFDVFNRFGTVDVVMDVSGFYQPLSSTGETGPPGPQGPEGPQGPQGETGPRGFSAWDEIPSGQTVTGWVMWSGSVNRDNRTHIIWIDYPGRATGITGQTDVNFAADGSAATTDDDPDCTGTFTNPTAPAGKVCLYRSASDNLEFLQGNMRSDKADIGFIVNATTDGAVNDDMYVDFAWAYTAP